MPVWKFGMLSRSEPGWKKGSFAVQELTLTSRSMRAAMTATAFEPPWGAASAAEGTKSGSSSIRFTISMPIG